MKSLFRLFYAALGLVFLYGYALTFVLAFTSSTVHADSITSSVIEAEKQECLASGGTFVYNSDSDYTCIHYDHPALPTPNIPANLPGGRHG